MAISLHGQWLWCDQGAMIKKSEFHQEEGFGTHRTTCWKRPCPTEYP